MEEELLECVIDRLGLCQVFAWEKAGQWLIGNNVDVLRHLIPERGPDPLGVSSLLTLGWPVDGRTLIDGLRVLQGGCLHRWTGSARTARALCTPEQLAPRKLQSAPPSTRTVTAELKKTVRAAAQCGPVRCGVTAGRDSRVVLSLLNAAGVTGSCYTVGQEGHPDVEAGRRLSSMMGFDHHVWNPELPSDSDWPSLTGQFISQTNGLANIAAIADWVDNQRENEPIAVKLWGIGGEIGRGAIGIATALACNLPPVRSSVAVQRRVLTKNISVADGLFSDECAALTRDALHRFVDVRREEGWRTREVLEAAYAFERVSHWGAAGVRRACATTDVFSPFVTTDFLQFAFAMRSGARYVEAPHRMLLDELAPELRDVAFNRPWRPQYPELAPVLIGMEAVHGAASRRSATKRSALASRRSNAGPGMEISGRRFDQFGHAWLESGITHLRDEMLARPESPVWDYLNRQRVEKLLHGDADTRSPFLEPLCRVLTVFTGACIPDPNIRNDLRKHGAWN